MSGHGWPVNQKRCKLPTIDTHSLFNTFQWVKWLLPLNSLITKFTKDYIKSTPLILQSDLGDLKLYLIYYGVRNTL